MKTKAHYGFHQWEEGNYPRADAKVERGRRESDRHHHPHLEHSQLAVTP
ncbi:MAG TPA: hypothetical protein VF078_12510 [Nitrospira sp.]